MIPIAASGLTYEAEIAGDLPDALVEAVTGASLLLQLQDGDEEPLTPDELIARVRADLDRLERALRSQGYYAGTASISIDGQPPDAEGLPQRLQALPEDAQVPVQLALETGPQYLVGDIDVAMDDGADLELDDADLPLALGDPARADQIIAYGAELNTRLQADGYPFAEVDRRAVVNHGERTMGLTFNVTAGPQARLGPVAVEGAERTDADFIAERAQFAEEEAYSPDTINAYRDRLAALELFRSIRIDQGEALNDQGELPLTVTVEERPPRTIGFGARYSTTEGGSLRGYWRHRNLLGRAERLGVEAEVGRLLENDAEDLTYRLGLRFEAPYFLGEEQTLRSGITAEREVLDAYSREAIEWGLSLERPITEALTAAVGVEVEQQRINDGDGADHVLLVGLPLSLSFDTRDDLLNPTQGVRAQAFVTPFSEWLGGDVSFVRARAEVAAFEDFGTEGDIILAGRLELGSIAGGGVAAIPPNRRFFAGGGGSVRGYPFQAIGPRDDDNEPVGGLSLFEASAELRLRFGDYGVVPFIDAGSVSNDEYPGFEDLRVGVGLGFRYFTSFGPLRIDVAVPLDPYSGDDEYAFYVSLGQSF